MKSSLEALRERYALARANRPPPPPLPPTPEPLIYHILNIRISQDRTRYYIPILATTSPTPSTLHALPTHLLILKQRGLNFRSACHHLSIYVTAPTLDLLPRPSLTLYTRPFIFHDTQAAHDEIKHQLQTQL